MCGEVANMNIGVTKCTEPMSLLEFQERFAADEACEQQLFKIQVAQRLHLP